MGLRYVAEGATPETALLPDGLAVRVEFYQDGYEGAPTTLDLVQQGLSKRYVMRDFIADAEVSVTLDDRAGGEAAGFFEAISEARDREWRVVTFVGGAKDWEGYLLPRRVGRTLEESGKRIVTVQAKSRFSELDNLPADEALTGTLSLAEITRRLLQPLAPLDVQAATDWYPVVDGDTFTDEPFGQLTIDTGSLEDDDGQPFTQAAALRQTHRRLQAKLIQESGVWQVYQDERLTDGSIRFTTFDGDGSTASNESRIINLEADGRTVTAQSRNPGSAGQLRQQAVRYNHGTIGGQILGNLDFQNSVQTASGDGNFNWRPAIDEGHSWSFNGGFVDVDTILVESFPTGVPNRFWQQFGGQIIGGPERQIAFSFDARLFAGGEDRTTAVNRLFYRLRVGDYYWNQSANEWQTSIANNPRTFQFLQGDVDVELTTAPLVDGGQPISGQVEVRLFSGWTETDDTSADPSFVRYQRVGFDLLTPDSEGELVDPEARLSTVQEIDTLGSEVATEESFAVGDGPTTIHASRLRFLTDAGDEVDLTDHWDKGPHVTETGTTLDELWATERLQRRRTALTRARVVVSSQGPLLPAAALYAWQGKLWTWERWTYTANAGDGQQYDILLREHKQSTGEFQTAFAEERLQPFATVGQRREAGVIKFSLLQELPEGFTTSPGLAYSDAQQKLSLLLDEGAGISIVQSGDALEISATGDVGDELVRTFNTRSGDVTLTDEDVTGALGFTPADENAQIGAGSTQGFSIDTVQLGGSFQIGVPQDLRTTAGVTFNAVTATNALQIPTIGTGGSGQPLPSGLTTSPGLAYNDAQQELSLLLDEGAGISIVQSGNALEISATGDVGGAGTWSELDGKPFESVDQSEFDDSTAVLRLGTVPAAKTSGSFDVAQIPELGAAKITAGTFDVARIPDLAASKITSGTFATARIPNLNASKITSGTFNVARIPDLNASKITAGAFPPARIQFDSARMFATAGGDLSVREIGGGSELGFSIATVTAGQSFDLSVPQDLRTSASVTFDGVNAVSSLQVPVLGTGGSGQPLPSGLTTSAGLTYSDAQQTLDLLLQAGSNITLTETGGAIEISSTGGSGSSTWPEISGKPFESVDQSEFNDDTSVLRLRDVPASKVTGTLGLSQIPTLGTGNVNFANQQLNTSSSPTFGGLDLTGDLETDGSIRLDDTPLWLRGGSDSNHSLVYHTEVDGPILDGWDGGALSRQDTIILGWTSAGVDVNGALTVSGNISGGNFNGSNWDTAFSRSVIGVSGSGNGTLTINQQVGSESTSLAHTHNASEVNAGTFDLARIPTLGTGKVDFADQQLNTGSSPTFAGLVVNEDLEVDGTGRFMGGGFVEQGFFQRKTTGNLSGGIQVGNESSMWDIAGNENRLLLRRNDQEGGNLFELYSDRLELATDLEVGGDGIFDGGVAVDGNATIGGTLIPSAIQLPVL